AGSRGLLSDNMRTNWTGKGLTPRALVLDYRMYRIHPNRGAQHMAGYKGFFDERGYYVARGLFSPEEVSTFLSHFMRLNAERQDAASAQLDPAAAGGQVDPLKLYPRMLQMHRWDALSLGYLIDPRINEVLTTLLGAEPYAVQ